MKKIIYIIFVAFNLINAFASSTPDEANAFLQKAIDFQSAKAIDSSNVYFQKAAFVFEEKKEWEKWIECYFEMGRNLRKYEPEKSVQYFEEAIHQGEQKLGENTLEVGRLYSYLGYIELVFLEKFDKAQKFLEKSINILENLTTQNDESLADAYRRIGAVFRRKAAYDKTVIYYQKAATLYEKLENWKRVANMEISIAQIYDSTGKEKEATKIYNKALQNPSLPFRYQLAIEQSLINLLSKEKKYEEAIKKAENLLELGQKQHPSGIHDELASIHSSIATISQLMENFDKALYHIKQAIKIGKHPEVYNGEGREMGEYYRAFADLLAKNGNFEQALKYQQKSLSIFIPDFKDTLNVNKNPPKEILHNEPRIMEVLGDKANTFYQKYLKSQNKEDLEAALKTHQLAITQLNLLKQNFRGENDQVWITGNEYNLYEDAIRTTSTLYQLTQDKKYANQIFQFIEDGKASVLLAVSQEAEAQQLSTIPDTLKKEIKSYKNQITDWKTKIFQTKELKLQQIYKDSIYQIERTLEKRIKELEANFPNYKDIKFDKQLVTLEQVQQYLQKNNQRKEAIIEFLIGEKQIYIFAITAQNVYIESIDKKDTFEQQIQNLRKLLSNQIQDEKLYFQIAYQLYETLLKPVLDKEENIEKLTIIPDGILAYIPFESLVTQQNDCQNNCYHINKTDYLVEKYIVSYAYSVSLLLDQKDMKNETDLSYLGFAPFAGNQHTNGQNAMRGCSNEELLPLNASKREINATHELLGGNIWENQKATKAAFLKEAPNHQILHLSTHACVDDQDPLFNRIYFADEPMLNYELYNMELNAKMAVLSACNTATGVLRKGEGIMSLARAFTYAGCPSIITSLWSVPDVETSKVIISFYEELAKGHKKDEALRNAKLQYLNQSSITAAESLPYFWAAFIPVGDMEMLSMPSPSKGFSYWTYLIAAFLFFGLLFFFQKMRK